MVEIENLLEKPESPTSPSEYYSFNAIVPREYIWVIYKEILNIKT